jgi:DNA-directed RNA polymerase specialized sigma24 family protein
MHELKAGLSRLETGNFFDSESVERLIADYQKTGESETLGRVIEKCEPIVMSLVRSRATMAYEREDELLSCVSRKLLVSIGQYDRTRGSAFSFVFRLTRNMLATVVTHRKKQASRYPALDPVLMVSVPDERAGVESELAVKDLVTQIRGIRSPATDLHEREAQKWYTESFIDCGFELRRHQCADSAMKVYGLSHRRSRQLYDLTLLEIRRALWDETRHEVITRKELRGTKGLPLIRYTNFLTASEFTKFAALMRDLAPYLVILVRPANEQAIKSGDWPAVRENLELVLNGIPDSTRLYPE